MSYAYDTIADIIRLAEENNISFGDVVLRYELENYDRNEEAVIREIEHRLDIFEMSIQDGISYTDKTASGMSGGQAAQLDGQSPRFMSEIAYKAMTYAIAVNEANAKMFRIVAILISDSLKAWLTREIAPGRSSWNTTSVNSSPVIDISLPSTSVIII